MPSYTSSLPQPDTESLKHTHRVKSHILDKILATPQRRISFADYMQAALYTPGLGYYAAGCHKFGRGGDFITAPEISPLFSHCLARQCAQLIDAIPGAHILEFGAGTGIMATDILLYLETIGRLPEIYAIMEISPDLQQRQYQTFQHRCPHLLERVQWLRELPERPLRGVILANEVLDAMPVHRFALKDGEAREFYVTNQQGDFTWLAAEPSCEALEQAIIEAQQRYLKPCTEYVSEICLLHTAWLQSLDAILAQGIILLIDYGYPEAEYYHPQRNQGTLMCHFRHHAHADPFVYPGIQDITAHVNFSRLARCAATLNLRLAGFTTQANFLINCGLADLIDANLPAAERMQTSKAVKLLTLPQEMGETFKVLALSRRIDFDLLGYKHSNRAHILAS